MTLRCALALVALGFLSACERGPTLPDGGSGNPDGGSLAFDIGTVGDDGVGYAPMPTQLFGEPGSQGGFHVSVSYRLPEGGVGSITFSHAVRRSSDGVLVSRGSRVFDLGNASEQAWTAPEAVRVFMCPTPLGVDIVNQALRVEVTAADASGRVLGVSQAQTTFKCSSSYCTSSCTG